MDGWRRNIKIVLDVTRLVQEGKITRDEAERGLAVTLWRCNAGRAGAVTARLAA